MVIFRLVQSGCDVMSSLVNSYNGTSSTGAGAGAASVSAASSAGSGGAEQPKKLRNSMLNKASSVTLLNIEVLLRNLSSMMIMLNGLKRDDPSFCGQIIAQAKPA